MLSADVQRRTNYSQQNNYVRVPNKILLSIHNDCFAVALFLRVLNASKQDVNAFL